MDNVLLGLLRARVDFPHRLHRLHNWLARLRQRLAFLDHLAHHSGPGDLRHASLAILRSLLWNGDDADRCLEHVVGLLQCRRLDPQFLVNEMLHDAAIRQEKMRPERGESNQAELRQAVDAIHKRLQHRRHGVAHPLSSDCARVDSTFLEELVDALTHLAWKLQHGRSEASHCLGDIANVPQQHASRRYAYSVSAQKSFLLRKRLLHKRSER